MKFLTCFISLLLSSVGAQAVSSPAGPLFTYEGVLTTTGGAPITTSQSVTFQVIYPPSCVLFSETHTINPGTSGEFSVIVGSGSRTDSTNNTAARIFASSGTVSCEGASNVAVSGFSARSLHIVIGGTPLTPDVAINNIPFAINAQKLADKGAEDFVQTSANITQINLESTYSRYSILNDVLNLFAISPSAGQVLLGNGSNYQPGSLIAGSNITITPGAGSITIAANSSGGTVTSVTGTTPISVATTTSTPVISISQAGISADGYLSSADWINFNSKLSPALNSGLLWVGNGSNQATAVTISGDASLSNAGSLSLANVGSAGTYHKVTTDSKGRVTSGAVALLDVDIPNLDWSKITTGKPALFSNGGNGFGAAATIGTTDVNSLSLMANNIVGMTIDSNARVGVGMTPLAASKFSITDTNVVPLDVRSSAGTFSAISIRNTTTVNYPWYLAANGTSSSWGQPGSFSLVDYGSGYTRLTVLNDGKVGLGTTSPGYLLHVNIAGTGAVAAFQNATGTCTVTPNTSSLSCSSDIRLKKNFEKIIGLEALNKILKLQAMTYHWKQGDEDRHIGYIAQEVEQTVPELVTTGSDGYKQVSYSGFVPLLSEAIKEVHINSERQKREIASIQEENSDMKKQLELLQSENETLRKDLLKIEEQLGLK